jgi:hypothetical protein
MRTVGARTGVKTPEPPPAADPPPPQPEGEQPPPQPEGEQPPPPPEGDQPPPPPEGDQPPPPPTLDAATQAETARLVAAKLKHLPPETRKAVQQVIDSRIGQIVATERTKSESLGARVAELTAELEQTQQAKGPPIIPGVHPVLLAETDTQIEARLREIRQAERALRRFEDTGIEGAEGQPSYTADQVRQRLDELADEREDTIPLARTVLAERQRIDGNLRKLLPEVFDPQTAAYRGISRVLKIHPELRRFPESRVIAVKLLLGEQRLGEIIAQKQEADKKTAEPPKKAPRAPAGNGAPRGSVVEFPRRGSDVAGAIRKIGADGNTSAAALSRIVETAIGG